jgi:hypothetical protein
VWLGTTVPPMLLAAEEVIECRRAPWLKGSGAEDGGLIEGSET